MEDYREMLNLYIGPILDSLLETIMVSEVLDEIFAGGEIQEETVKFEKTEDGWDIIPTIKIKKNQEWDGSLEDALYLKEKYEKETENIVRRY